MSADPEIVYCPLCEVPHTPAAVLCDSCGSELAKPVDIRRVRSEYAQRKRDIALASAAIVFMVAINFLFLYGVAVVALAPIGWLLHSLSRWHALRGYLARQSA